VEEDPGAFAHRVIQLLESHALRADTGARARAFVAKHHSWDVAGQALLPILDEVAGRARQVGPSRFISLKRLSRPD
jgi:glycosyltransferase involved in cell wall biosynthesis